MRAGRSDTLTVDAPAKVNLALRVLGRRTDGYHEIETLFQGIDLADEVTVELADEGVSLTVHGPDVGPMRDNLAVRAAEAFRSAAGRPSGVHIVLGKRIPAGAGLGGGSSDAAAVLRCLQAFTGALHADALAGIAAALGSDVPFFLGGSGLAIGTGRGEVLRGLPPLPAAHVVVALPPVHVPTAAAYRALGARRATRPGEPSCLSLAGVSDWSAVRALAHNDFEEVVVAMHPEIGRSLAALRSVGAELALLSGSGSASFGLFRDASRAAEVAERLTDELGWPCVSAATLDRPPPLRRS